MKIVNSIKTSRAAFVLGLVIVGQVHPVTAQVLYKNPVLAGDHPDPSIIRVGQEFWATCTSSEWGPQFPLLRSTDLVNWELTGSVFPHRPEWASANFWAPEISEYKGRFAVYYVGREPGGPLAVAVATADQPGGPYLDHGPLVAQEDGSIDPAPATDENGVRYLIWKEDGNSRHRPTPIWAQPLNEDGTKLTGEPHELIHNDAPWEGGVVEGPSILRRNGWFYLFYSGNGCCGASCDYALGVARSRALLGPWEKNPANPILAGNENWKCPGHGSVVGDAQGRYWFLYHAYSTSGTVFTGREGMLDEVKFGANDWPTIHHGDGPSTYADSPFGMTQQKTGASFTDDFHGRELDAGWQWPQAREPLHDLKNGRLVLSATAGGAEFLGAVLARPTTAPDYVATASIETKHLAAEVSVGLCVIGDLDNAMGATLKSGHIITWRRHRSVTRQLAQQPAPEGEKIYLRVTARHGYNYAWAVSAGAETWMPCGESADAKDLPPWDRSVRVALTVGGASGAEGTFESFSILPVGTPPAK